MLTLILNNSVIGARDMARVILLGHPTRVTAQPSWSRAWPQESANFLAGAEHDVAAPPHGVLLLLQIEVTVNRGYDRPPSWLPE